MATVKIDLDLIIKLNQLAKILFEEEYFGFIESSEKYIHKIYDFIYLIPTKPIFKCKSPRFGTYYAVFKMNNNTHYYLTFDFENDNYLINSIFNNHEEGYTIYIK